MRRSILLGALAAMLAACGGGGGRLSKAECEQWAERFLRGPGEGPGMFDEPGMDELKVELMRELVARCVDGEVDRREIECLAASTDEPGDIRCTQEGAERTKRNPFAI